MLKKGILIFLSVAALAAAAFFLPGFLPVYEGVAMRSEGRAYAFRAYGPDAQNAVDAAATRAESIFNVVQGHPGADAERVTAAAGGQVSVDPATLYLLDVSLRMWERTAGRFCVAGDMGALRVDYAALLCGVGAGDALSLDGLTDAYAADQAASVARDYGIASGYFATRGEAVALGGSLNGGWWTYPIPSPDGSPAALGVLLLRDQAAATYSADGLPAEAGGVVLSATVLADSAVEAAALARACAGLGRLEAEALVGGFAGAQAVFVLDTGEVRLPDALGERFSLRRNAY